ncbi:hypothetical protein MRX96_045665 [Rhipicephalus microplus]
MQPAEAHPQSQLTNSHPWTLLLAPSGGTSLKQSQVTQCTPFPLSSSLTKGVAIFLMFIMWLKQKKATVNASEHARFQQA